MANRDSYDAIIIGAGIGGLVCGCYLAKAGMKVLIVEQHDKPRGYFTSRNCYFYIRSLDPAASCEEYARYPFKRSWVPI